MSTLGAKGFFFSPNFWFLFQFPSRELYQTESTAYFIVGISRTDLGGQGSTYPAPHRDVTPMGRRELSPPPPPLSSAALSPVQTDATLFANNSQHATTCNRVYKPTQHVTSNNVGSCWQTTLGPFARSITLISSNPRILQKSIVIQVQLIKWSN